MIGLIRIDRVLEDSRVRAVRWKGKDVGSTWMVEYGVVGIVDTK